MTTSLLKDAFAHHAWATLRVIDTCLALSPEQVQTTVPGTYGSILDTMRHLVQADASYLSVTTGGRVSALDAVSLDLPQLRAEMDAHSAAWVELLSQDLDPDTVLVRHRPDGSESHAPLGIRLAQALHHGTDHRSQICTALTSLGIEPPDIDVWDFAKHDGRLVETAPTT
jgi:uncharacterized damage-inducible protein DinB